MYQKFIQLSEDSYIEITTRLYNQGQSVVLALRGTKNDSDPAIASIILDPSEMAALLKGLQEASKDIEEPK